MTMEVLVVESGDSSGLGCGWRQRAYLVRSRQPNHLVGNWQLHYYIPMRVSIKAVHAYREVFAGRVR